MVGLARGSTHPTHQSSVRNFSKVLLVPSLAATGPLGATEEDAESAEEQGENQAERSPATARRSRSRPRGDWVERSTLRFEASAGPGPAWRSGCPRSPRRRCSRWTGARPGSSPNPRRCRVRWIRSTASRTIAADEDRHRGRQRQVHPDGERQRGDPDICMERPRSRRPGSPSPGEPPAFMIPSMIRAIKRALGASYLTTSVPPSVVFDPAVDRRVDQVDRPASLRRRPGTCPARRPGDRPSARPPTRPCRACRRGR